MTKTLCALMFSIALACSLSMKPIEAKSVHHKLTVTDIAGYYVGPKDATERTMSIHLVRAYTNSGFEQADFNGKFGSNSIVGQAIIPGDEDKTADYVSFDFLSVQPQIDTIYKHCTSIMKNGVVVGVDVKTGDEDHGVQYRRVTKAQYLAVYKK